MHLLQAELYDVDSQPDEAKHHYLQALQVARDRTHDHAVIQERLGDFYQRTNQKLLAVRAYRIAIGLYEAWGAQAKAQQLHDAKAHWMVPSTVVCRITTENEED